MLRLDLQNQHQRQKRRCQVSRRWGICEFTRVTCCLPNLKYLKLSAGDIANLHRGTPLYGQPSWWGDGDADDENSLKHDAKASEQKQATCEAGKINCCRVQLTDFMNATRSCYVLMQAVRTQ